FYLYDILRSLYSFPTRRSSDLNILIYTEYKDSQQRLVEALLAAGFTQLLTLSGEDSEGDRLTINTIFRTQSNQILVATDAAAEGDRKSTRLNSSHVSISYAVFC